MSAGIQRRRVENLRTKVLDMVDLRRGSIEPGDLLVASSTPSYAMRWGPGGFRCGLVGKALESLAKEQGLILVLLMH